MKLSLVLSWLAVLLIGETAARDREMWSTLAHHERDLERVAARRILQEEEEGGEVRVRQERKVENSGKEEIEARFFLQDKLCALGLASCEKNVAEALQYVQPVQVIPVGSPVPAVAVGSQPYIPTQTVYPNSNNRASSSYDAPSYSPPKPSYSPPRPTYQAPKATYNPPPKPSYNAPSSSYSAPSSSYGAPSSSYGAPSSSYGAPSSSYGAPSTSFAAPPTSSFGAPSIQSSVGSSSSYLSSKLSYQTGFGDEYSETLRPTREGRLEECYCVPATQCPASQVIGNFAQLIGSLGQQGSGQPQVTVVNAQSVGGSVVKDYSALINPRVKNSELNITAEEATSGSSEDGSRKLYNEYIPEEEEATEAGVEEELAETPRQRRDSADADQPEPSQKQNRRLENSFAAENSGDINPVESKDSDDIIPVESKLGDSSIESLLLDEEDEEDAIQLLKQKLKEERKKQRLKKIKATEEKVKVTEEKAGSGGSEEKPKLTEDDADVGSHVDEDGEIKNKSFESLSSLTSDVSNKVGNVGQSVKTGVQKIFGGITNLITGSTGNGTLQPTVGVSFGLPAYGPGYGGYAQNPISSDSFVNPYYTAQQGLGLGPVNVNPLFSFQTGTNDDGELSLRPLVNFHLTPNGCGVLGCDKALADEVSSFPHNMLKAIADPFKLFGGGGHVDGHHGISADYTAPKPSYGAPEYGYAAPQPDYGAPSPSYGAPSPSYGPPVSPQYDYGAVVIPAQRYPQSDYSAPKPSYDAPAPQFVPASGQQQQTHYHHHYYHQQDLLPQDQYGREDSLNQPNEGDSVAKADTEVFKRHTVPNSAGFLPVNMPSGSSGSAPASGSSKFKFPRARSLEAGGEEASKSAEELIEPRNNGGSEARRRRRSPDGVGHHAGGGVHHHHPQQQQQAALVDTRAQAGNVPFGPTGFRPPTCGGPGSGYVCCRAGAATTIDVNELTLDNSIRDVRQQPNQVLSSEFSRFGQCGRRNAQQTSGRINNSPASTFSEGDTEFGEYPWQVAILKKEQYDNVYVCGGSLIDGSHLLTAAHCVAQYRPEELRVRLGEWDVNNDSEFYPNIELDVLSMRIHPEFHSGNLYNDLAVIRLDGHVDFQRNPHISPVCLPDTFQDFSNKRCWVTGWGKDAFGDAGNYQHVMKEVDVPVVPNPECERRLRQTRLGLDFALHPGFMCAGGEEGKDACKGDGGGPLVCEVNGVWQLAGLVSWGIGCGQKSIPGVYVKVGQYNNWIQESMLTG